MAISSTMYSYQFLFVLVSEPLFLQPVNVFQFACQSLTMIREMTSILPVAL